LWHARRATVPDIFQTLINEQHSEIEESKRVTPSYCEHMKRQHHRQIEAEGHKAGPIDVIVKIAMKYHGEVPMAVASSGWRDHVLDGLERNGILHLFNTVVTADDEMVHNPKPSPDIFLVAAQKIGVPPELCIGFEDADFGMDALRRANYLYACDVRMLYNYPRNIERRLSSMASSNSDVREYLQ